MLYKLGIGLAIPATVLSLTTWADAEDVKQLYKNEFAQIGLQQASSQNAQIPEYDDEGNPIPPANQLYPVCFNDFQQYIKQIDGFINNIADLDSNLIPGNSQALWDIRDSPSEDRDMQKLAEEYNEAIKTGSWPEGTHTPPVYAKLSNPHCDYLPEFKQMRSFIKQRKRELEDKTDFAAWMANETLNPPDPCADSRSAFQSAANSLLEQITTQEQAKSALLKALFDEFGQESQELADFSQNLQEQFEAAKKAGDLPEDNPLQNDKPDTVAECAAETDPIGQQIDDSAANLKDLQDFLAFPGGYLCSTITAELQALFDSNSSPLENAKIQTHENILNLLVIQYHENPEQTADSLTEDLTATFKKTGTYNCEAGFDLPYDSVPATCEGGEAAEAFEALKTLRSDTSEGLCFMKFVQEQLDNSCGTAHTAAIADLDSLIEAKDSEKTALFEELFKDFAMGDEDLKTFTEIEEGFATGAIESGQFVGSAKLMDDKPDVPESCEEDVAESNTEIDMKAAQLKMTEDIMEFLKMALCAGLDTEIRNVMTTNLDDINEPRNAIVGLIGDLAMIMQRSDEDIQQFNLRIYNDYLKSGIEQVDPDFSQPIDPLPAVCADDDASFQELQQLIDDTRDALTYRVWLQGALESACSSAEEDFKAILSDVEGQLNDANIQKSKMITDFYEQLSDHHTFLEDYQADLQSQFMAARDAGEITNPSDITVDAPEVPESCAAIVEPITEEIVSSLAQLNTQADCIDWVKSSVCDGLATQAEMTLSDNSGLLEEISARVNELLQDLIQIDGQEGEDLLTFDKRLQKEQAADSNAPTAEAPFSAPSAKVPESCGDKVDYTEINEFISFVTSQLSYELYLKNKLKEECGETATELGTISADLDDKLKSANTLREECLDQFYAAFHTTGQTFEAFTMIYKNAFEEAKAAGEIPENDITVDIPESPDTCSHYVDAIEMEIYTTLSDLKGKQDFTRFLIHDVCSNLGETVTTTIQENAGADEEIATRINAILNDIIAIEGIENEDHLQLEMRLRTEFSKDSSAVMIESEIKLPSTSVPVKCADSVNYEALEELIKKNANNLSFEAWLENRLLESCHDAEVDFWAVSQELQEKIDQAEFDKTEIAQTFYKEWINPSAASGYGQHSHPEQHMMEADLNRLDGEEMKEDIPTFAEYAIQLREAFKAAVEAGEITDPFQYDVQLPETPDSCAAVVEPFIEDIRAKVAQLSEYKDCISYTANQVCSEIGAAADQIFADNEGKLKEVALLVAQKLNLLRPVISLEDENQKAFAERMTGAYRAALASGAFKAVPADFSTPTKNFPEACEGIADYAKLNKLIADVTDANSYDAWLQEQINDAIADSLAAHMAELNRIIDETTAAEKKQEELIEHLYESFDIEGQTLKEFNMFLNTEFDELKAAGMLPETPIVVETTEPPIPAGMESLVEELRQQIKDAAVELGCVLDFNAFAFDFVCEEIVDKIDKVKELANARLDQKNAELDSILADLFLVEAEEGESEMAFNARLAGEFINSQDNGSEEEDDGEYHGGYDSHGNHVHHHHEEETADESGVVEEPIELPIDEVPMGCASGQAKLSMLQTTLEDIQKIDDFVAFLRPRIDDAAMLLLMCMEMKDEITEIVNDNFSKWTDCINEKSAILSQMYADPDEAEEGEEFLDFLNRIRAEYDEQKDAGMVHIIDPMIVIPEVKDACPDETKQQQSVAEQFNDILEDCISYLEWLKARAGGFCEVEQFIAVINLNKADSQSAANAIEGILENLFQIKAEDDESEEDFNARMRGDFDADEDAPVVTSDAEVPETSVACPQDAQDAHQSAVGFIEQLNDSLSYIAWLTDLLEECCNDLEADYDGLKFLASHRLPPLQEQRDALEHALFVFKGLDADEATGAAAETEEEFKARYKAEYDATNPLIIPIMSTSTFIDVPELCTPSSVQAAEELLAMVAELNDVNAYVLWMRAELQKCSETVEMSIDQLIELRKPDLVQARQAKQANLDDLFTFAANEDEEKSAFDERMNAEFQAYIAETGMELMPTGIVIPDVPELAHDDTEEARDELVKLDQDLSYCKTFTMWLADEIFEPCDELRVTLEEQLTTESPRRDASEAEQMSLLATLKSLKDEDDELTDTEFAVEMGKMYAATADFPAVDPEIMIPSVPQVCQEETQTAASDLQSFVSDLGANLSFESWLWEQTQGCCQDLGIEYNQQRKEKEVELAAANDAVNTVAASLMEIDQRSMQQLIDDFTAATEAGEVKFIGEQTVAAITPEECQQSVKDARQKVVDICLEVNIQMTFEGWLQEQLVAACTNQAGLIQEITESLLPSLGDMDAEKSELFAAWNMLEGMEGQDAAAFEVAKLLEFNELYEAGEVNVIQPNIFVPNLPEACGEEDQATLESLESLVADLTRQASLCDWLRNELDKACTDMTETLTGLLASNMNRLPNSASTSASILQELFETDITFEGSLKDYTMNQADAFAASGVTPEDTGVVVPAIPSECMEETMRAAAALDGFLDDLGVALAYQKFLQDQLNIVCDDIVLILDGQITDIDRLTDETCAPATLQLQRDLFDLKQSKEPSDEQFIDFALALRGEYEELLAEMKINVISSGIQIPSLPDNCSDDHKEVLRITTEKDIELEDCLSYGEWISETLQKACTDCGETFLQQMDDELVILQAAELRIVEQLDNLYLLEDPEVDGEPQVITAFSDDKFNEFTAAGIEGEDPGFRITELAPDCSDEVKETRAQLQKLADDIGKAFAYETWLKEMVKEQLKSTENEFLMIINDNQARSDDAAITVANTINQLGTYKKEEGETNQAFAGRMKITFDKSLDSGEVEPIETGLEIPDLPSNAPPSTTGARHMLEMFDDTLSYQLTWAQYLNDMMVECCRDIASGYLETIDEFTPMQAQTVLEIATILDQLISVSDVEEGKENDFAIGMRAEFDMNQKDPETAIDAVFTGIEIVEPPKACSMETLEAQDALMQFGFSLSDLLTYKAFLDREFGGACSSIRDEIETEATMQQGILDEKEDVLTAQLENLFMILGNDGEEFADFTMRIRKIYDADENSAGVASGVVVPDVPMSCDEETLEAQKGLQDIADELTDCLSYQLWLDDTLNAECDAKAAEFNEIVENPPHSMVMVMAQVKVAEDADSLIDDLFKLQGEAVQAPSLELFGVALRQSFDLEREDPEGEIVEQESGIVIDEIPDACQQSTQDAREALVMFEKEIQDSKTYQAWLKRQLQLAVNMNAEECDELAASYQTLIDENKQRVKDSKARQHSIKKDAHSIKANEGEDYKAFGKRLRMEYDEYVPIPIDPEIEYMEVPITCQESTFEANMKLKDFITELSEEITYEGWLADTLKTCCDDLLSDISMLDEPSRLDDSRDAIATMLADLQTLRGEKGESAEQFAERIMGDFDGQGDDVDTEIEIPEVPKSCNELTPAIKPALESLTQFKTDLQTSLNLQSWLSMQLAEACEEPTAAAQKVLDAEEGRIDAAKAEQQVKLNDLIVFKGLNGESLSHFGQRLRQVFDNYVTHRRNTGITAPTFPAGCVATQVVGDEVDAMITSVANEETYNAWLGANLDACCDDRFEDIMDLIEVNMPALEEMQTERDDIISFMYEFSGVYPSLEAFTEALNQQFASLIADEEIEVGQTGLAETVPPVPDACEMEVKDAQATLRTLADGIEDLDAQLRWLRPLRDDTCVELEPSLASVLMEMGPMVDFTRDDNDALIADLFAMQGQEGEDLDDFTANLRGIFIEQVDAGEVQLVDVMIDVPEINDGCPESTQKAYEAAQVHAYSISIFQTMGPWLEARVAEACDDNAALLDSLITSNEESRANAVAEVEKQLEQGISISGEQDETAEAFEERMKLAFTQSDTTSPMASGLPAFSEDCDPEDSARLMEATTVINESLATQTFAVYLREQFKESCDNLEFIAYDSQIDADGLTARENAKSDLLNQWFDIATDKPEGETFEQFAGRINGLYMEAAPETENSQILVVEYPDDCDMYSTSIEASYQALIQYKDDLEECLTFEKWAQAQVDALGGDMGGDGGDMGGDGGDMGGDGGDMGGDGGDMGGDGGDMGGDGGDMGTCEEDIAQLENEAATLKILTDESASQSNPKVNNFLDIVDQANTEGLEDAAYLSEVLAPLLSVAIQNGELNAAELQEPSITLGSDCDQKALVDFEEAATELAAQQTLSQFIDDRINGICEGNEAGLGDAVPAAQSEAESKAVEATAWLTQNFNIEIANGSFDGDFAAYTIAQNDAFDMDDTFMALDTFEASVFPIAPLPTGFCGDNVDAAQAELEQAAMDYDVNAAFAEFLQNKQNSELSPIFESAVAERAAEVTSAASATQTDVDTRIQALFDQDQMRAMPLWTDVEQAKSFLEVEFNQALDELPMEQSGEAPIEIPADLEAQLAEAAEEVNGNIAQLDLQLTLLKWLNEYQIESDMTTDGGDSQECTQYKEIIQALSSEKQSDAQSQLNMLGDNNNEASLMNFDDNGNFAEPEQSEIALPVDDLPPSPEGCDASAEVTEFENSGIELSRAMQFFDWCNANPGDVADGLCGPQA